MKKLIVLSLVAALSASVVAAEAAKPAPAKAPATDEAVVMKKRVWPAFFAFCQWPDSPDVIGLRLTLPFSTRQENITGIDVGLWGRAIYFEGIMCNVLRNDVQDQMSGIQVGLYNSFSSGDMFGAQIGLWNEADSFRGVQAGLVNAVGTAQGFQVGLINRAESLYGFQVGLINVIRDAELTFFPGINIGF